MASLEGLFAMTAAVLVISGVLKVRDPAPTAAMLRRLHAPSAPWAAVALGLVEIVAGVGAIVIGGSAVAAAVAVLYAGFTGISIWLVRADDGTDCGCFGSRSAPMTMIHVVLNALMAVVATAAAVASVPGFPDIAGELPWAGVPQLGFVVLGALLVVALMTVLPETMAAASDERAGAAGRVQQFHLVAAPVRRNPAS